MIALALTLMALAGTSSPRHPTSGSEHVILVDSPDTTGTVNLGGITAGLDHTGLTVDFGAPGGPQLKPDIAVGAEPGEAIDGLVVPLVKGVMKGSGQVSTHTPTIGSVKSIGVNLGVEGKITATVHSYEGLLSVPPSGR